MAGSSLETLAVPIEVGQRLPGPLTLVIVLEKEGPLARVNRGSRSLRLDGVILAIVLDLGGLGDRHFHSHLSKWLQISRPMRTGKTDDISGRIFFRSLVSTCDGSGRRDKCLWKLRPESLVCGTSFRKEQTFFLVAQFCCCCVGSCHKEPGAHWLGHAGPRWGTRSSHAGCAPATLTSHGSSTVWEGTGRNPFLRKMIEYREVLYKYLRRECLKQWHLHSSTQWLPQLLVRSSLRHPPSPYHIRYFNQCNSSSRLRVAL